MRSFLQFSDSDDVSKKDKKILKGLFGYTVDLHGFDNTTCNGPMFGKTESAIKISTDHKDFVSVVLTDARDNYCGKIFLHYVKYKDEMLN